VAKVGTSNPDRTISLKRLQCVVENNNNARSLPQGQGQSVNMETRHEQDSNSGRLRDLSHCHNVQTRYGAHPTSYPTGIKNISLR
jgi:hypothetical protein